MNLLAETDDANMIMTITPSLAPVEGAEAIPHGYPKKILTFQS